MDLYSYRHLYERLINVDIYTVSNALVSIILVYLICTIINLELTLNPKRTDTPLIILPGRFRAVLLTALGGGAVITSDLIFGRITKSTLPSIIVKVCVLAFVVKYVFKICANYDLSNPTGDDEDDVPFTSTLGISFSLWTALTFPILLTLVISAIVLLIQAFALIESYKFLRVVPLIIITSIEAAIAQFIVFQLNSFDDLILSIVLVNVVMAVSNILMTSLNPIILDKVTNGFFEIKD